MLNDDTPLNKQRRANLRTVLAEQGGPASFAKKLGQSGPSFLSQMVNGHRVISERTCRRIEREAGKPIYWMDQPHTGTGGVAPTQTVRVDPSFVGGAVKMVAEIQQELKTSLTPEKYADIVNLVYEHAQLTGKLDRDFSMRLVKLTM
ncbi:hypothetical protein LMG26854_03339 [Achromobacter aegrifaciens]|uniref:hypothetical protein n=1 Tax=Achromobacter aegrifaciens TaxID=1287736 RepID=UPI001466AD95|nr:hypothetical protein [Achromobacter aegrifaciens]CAB3858428.1 hypothetical protein LMG26854_03339 [Achromobacter aegrifaciens]